MKLTKKNKMYLRRVRFMGILIILILLIGNYLRVDRVNYMPYPPVNEFEAIIKECIVKDDVGIVESYRREITDKNYNILLRIVEAETTSHSINEKENVAQCILNRVDGNEFKGDTVEKIVFQPVQFSPIKDRRYYNVEITETTIQAVENVLHLKQPKHNALFFKAKWCESDWFDKNLSKVKVKDGIHDYYNPK